MFSRVRNRHDGDVLWWGLHWRGGWLWREEPLTWWCSRAVVTIIKNGLQWRQGGYGGEINQWKFKVWYFELNELDIVKSLGRVWSQKSDSCFRTLNFNFDRHSHSLANSLFAPSVSQRSPHGHAVHTTALSEIFTYLKIATFKYQKWICTTHASHIPQTSWSTG